MKPKQQSTTDFLNMSFTPPKKDIVQMLTPSKERQTTAIIPYKRSTKYIRFFNWRNTTKNTTTIKNRKGCY